MDARDCEVVVVGVGRGEGRGAGEYGCCWGEESCAAAFTVGSGRNPESQLVSHRAQKQAATNPKTSVLQR